MLNTPNVFCVETSFFGYNKKDKIEHFLPEDLFKMGEDIVRAMYLFSIEE